MTWTRGQRIPLDDLGVGPRVAVGLGFEPASQFRIVVAGLDDDEDLVDRSFLLSPSQREVPGASVTLTEATDGDVELLDVDLQRVPSSVSTIRVALDGLGTTSTVGLARAWVRVIDGPRGREVGRWAFTGDEHSGERTLLLVDIHRRGDGWRLVVLGSGYRAGLRAFLDQIDGPDRLPGEPMPGTGRGEPPSPGAPSVPPPPAPVGGAPAPSPEGSSPGAPRPTPVGTGTLRTGLTWRQRIFSVPVAKAMASPSGVGAAAAGAAVGGLGVGVALGAGAAAAVGAAAATGAAAWAGRGALAMPRRRGDRIDPYAVQEPWRYFVRDAVEADRTFQQLVDRTPEGPVRDRLVDIAARMREAVEEAWRIALRGQNLVESRRAIDDTAVRAELASLQGDRTKVAPGEAPPMVRALRNQVAAADRLDRVIDETYDRLRLIDARIDDAVARALEISATSTDSTSFGGLGSDVDVLVDELEALRQGLEEVRGIDPATG